MEKTCKKRDNCKYYTEDFFRRYRDQLDDCDFLVCYEPCRYYLPRREEVKVELKEDQDIFNIR